MEILKIRKFEEFKDLYKYEEKSLYEIDEIRTKYFEKVKDSVSEKINASDGKMFNLVFVRPSSDLLTQRFSVS